MRHTLLLLAAIALSFPGRGQPYIPDHERTPGAIHPDITKANIHETVCVSGYTKTIRPPSYYTGWLKAQQIRELGLPGTMRDYHGDHLLPLYVGGHPRNLRPEPVAGKWSASAKDQLESSVCRQVCRGDITVQEEQAIFLRPDWRQEYLRHFGLN
jgi:hypothetical protein